jgi:hypothetical protein
MDAFMELRSMILLELACPPLPMMAVRQETGEQTLTNTHDLMSVFLLAAFRRQDKAENARRRTKQINLTRLYMQGLEHCRSFNQTYFLMASFITEYLATYLLPGCGFTRNDIRVLPVDYISAGLRDNIRSYCRGMRTVAGLDAAGLLPDDGVEALFADCVRSAVHKQKQGVVGVAVLEGVGECVREEGHDPQAFEAGVKVLGNPAPLAVGGCEKNQN